MGKDIILLQIRNAIVDKEFVVAAANRETAQGGWLFDHVSEMNRLESVIQGFIDEYKRA